MVFGRRPIIEAIKAEKTFDKLFVQKSLSGELAEDLLKTAKENKVV
ncbi:MAG: 23S rRNA (guanosine(2251)-2'-O)-methyltransferase RlmB, partial [Bacteroidetes bacterium]